MELAFTNPQYLWILLIIPFLAITHIFALKKKRAAALNFANFDALERVSKGDFLGKPYFGIFRNKNIFLLLIRLITYSLLILSISGATLWYVGQTSSFDFVLAIDTSASMLADDFSPNRLEAAKEAASLFVDSVPGNTEIGVVSFAGVASTEVKLADSRPKVKNVTNNLRISEVGGTNIGDAIITSVNVLGAEERDDESDVIILLTDGQSNVGTSIDEAIGYAKENNVIVHTIGVGTSEGGEFLFQDIVSRLDEGSLKKIASETAGKYYRVEDKEVLGGAFKELAAITEKRLSFDLSWVLLAAGLALLSIEWILINTKYRTIP
ncbi:MAG: VWA domain-containing protein [Nanoarchaeota archaeon]|nr:VWA domain-containing protein [Nanoarchaeota archaeon]MBU1005525.1 VWA domain-containing protein [Nanoarchaeota archaeon]MBU1945864.1 VWA domain-containing protein [Nanoarchaeota archaeon]